MSGTFSLADLLSVEESLYRTGARLHGLRRLDARLKLALSAAAVLANVLVARAWLSAALLGAGWLALAASRVSWRQALWFILAPAWATSLVVAGLALGFGHTPLAVLGPLTVYREGLAAGGEAGLRVLAEMSWAAALMLTTPFTEILNALRSFKLPEVLVDTLGYMYRYLFLLYDEYAGMRAAAQARGGFAGLNASLRSTGQIFAHVFLRALERAGRIQQAIRARGGE